VRHKGLPFEVKIPNETTQKAIKEAKGKNVENISLDELKRMNNAKS
jgi:DNA-damage-inducible protein J